jgi:hypothetical protein
VELTDRVEITIRALGPSDEGAVRALAGRDSAPVPAGHLVGAVMNGELVAARSLSTGEGIADPFVRTVEVRALLDEHASRLDGASHDQRRRRGLFRRRSRASLPSSPPGAGGRLVILDRTS